MQLIYASFSNKFVVYSQYNLFKLTNYRLSWYLPHLINNFHNIVHRWIRMPHSRLRILCKDAQANCFRVQIQMLHLDMIFYFMTEHVSIQGIKGAR